MKHVLENDTLIVTIDQQGAELTSLIDKRKGVEHIWQANPNIWGWHAPVLFPVIGRCFDDKILVEGESYDMPKHGLARVNTFECVEEMPDKLVFLFRSSNETQKNYPYLFDFFTEYRLSGNQLFCTHKVVNKGLEPMYFQLGAHPAFAIPFFSNESRYEYFIEFEKEEQPLRHYINSEGYFTGETGEAITFPNVLKIQEDTFNHDALIFKDLVRRAVTLKSAKHKSSVRVDFTDYAYLGIWAKPQADYVCIEPWLGCADNINAPQDVSEKEGVIKLEGDKQFEAVYSINIS